MASWTDKQRRYIEEYCVDFNGAAAARRAGYSEKTAKSAAHRLMQDEDIQAAIEERLDELALTAAEATKRMADIAQADLSDCFVIEEKSSEEEADASAGEKDARLSLERILAAGKGHLIKRVRPSKYGMDITIHDSQRALKTLMEARGVFTQQIDVTSGGEPITGIDVAIHQATTGEISSAEDDDE